MIDDLGFKFRPYYGFIYRRLLPTYNLYDSLNVLQVEVVQRNPHDWDACIYLLTTWDNTCCWPDSPHLKTKLLSSNK